MTAWYNLCILSCTSNMNEDSEYIKLEHVFSIPTRKSAICVSYMATDLKWDATTKDCLITPEDKASNRQLYELLKLKTRESQILDYVNNEIQNMNTLKV